MEQKLNDLIVLIPSYEPTNDFVEYAKIVSGFAKELIVVNDGSGPQFDPIFSSIAELENVVYISYPKNMGKGYALKQGFKYCQDNHDQNDIIVRADCDGQHTIEDIKKVYWAVKSHPKAFVLGSRDMNSPNVPARSKVGNKQIRRMFKFFYGLKMYDSQTGLRGATVEITSKLIGVKGDRFDYEHSELIFLKKNKFDILEVPIKTIYPENVEDHVSHFRTFKDGIRVFGAMLKNLGAYLISSALSAVLDVLIFYLFVKVILIDRSAVNSLIATITARVLSSILNFALNYKYVFNGASKKSIYRYYILWISQLCASYLIVLLFGNIMGFNLTITKIIGDLILAVISYQIQQNWVFRVKDARHFYTRFSKFALSLGRKFSKEYRCNVLPYDEPVVYVCRHLNMHGPYTTLKWLRFNVHPLILSKFFTVKECYKQFNEYTFSAKKNKNKKRFSIKTWIASFAVSKTVKSLKSVPVYRGSLEIKKTFNLAMKYLEAKESLIVYPDIEYTFDANKESEIYDGFLFLGKLYKKETGNDLRFVPIYINEEDKTINECESVVINDFKLDREQARRVIKEQINRRK